MSPASETAHGVSSKPMHDFFSVEALERQFQRYCTGHHDVFAGAPKVPLGYDGIRLDLFERDKDKHLRAMSRKLLQGRYTFARWLIASIPKGNGDTRDIAVAGVRDAIVQRAIYEAVYDRIDARLGPNAYGFRRRTNAHKAVHAIRNHFNEGRTSVFDADIQKFFDTVDHDLLMTKVRALGLDDLLVTLIWRFLRTGRTRRDGDLVSTNTKGLPQGGVLSGLLANLFLAEFDETVSRCFAGLVRYADDFVVCCSSEAECREAHELCASELSKLKLQLHPKKTLPLVRAEDGLDFLGFTITQDAIRIRAGNIDRFKARVEGVIEEWRNRGYDSGAQALRALVWALSFKVRGPGQEHVQEMLDRRLLDHPYRRNWPAFFRIATDETQFSELDRWLRRRISAVMWDRYRARVTLSQMQENGLPSLVNTVWKARRRVDVAV